MMKITELRVLVLLLLSCTCIMVSSFLSVYRYSTKCDHCKVTRVGFEGEGIFSKCGCKWDTKMNRKVLSSVTAVSSITSLWAVGFDDAEDSPDENLLLSLSVKSVEIFESAAGTIKGKRAMVNCDHYKHAISYLVRSLITQCSILYRSNGKSDCQILSRSLLKLIRWKSYKRFTWHI